MIKRMSKTDYYLEIAKIVAMRSTCLHHKYGAIIVKDDKLIASGYNGAPRGEHNCCDVQVCWRDDKNVARHAIIHGGKYGTCVAVHAEQNAMLCASSEEMRGAIMYLACLDDDNPIPCNICDRMIRNSGISRVITKADTHDVTPFP